MEEIDTLARIGSVAKTILGMRSWQSGRCKSGHEIYAMKWVTGAFFGS